MEKDSEFEHLKMKGHRYSVLALAKLTSETMSFMDGPFSLRTRLVWRSKEEKQLICVCKLGHSHLNECLRYK